MSNVERHCDEGAKEDLSFVPGDGTHETGWEHSDQAASICMLISCSRSSDTISMSLSSRERWTFWDVLPFVSADPCKYQCSCLQHRQVGEVPRSEVISPLIS